MAGRWETIKKGLVREEWKGIKDGHLLEWVDGVGLVLSAFLKSPNQKEIEAYSELHRFKIAFRDIGGVGFFSFKFGNEEWADCAFTPCIYEKVPKFTYSEKSEVMELHIMLIDTEEGVLKVFRSIHLNEEFSDYIRDWCLDALNNVIDRTTYFHILDDTFQKYGVGELAKIPDSYWERNLYGEEHEPREERTH